MSHRAIEIAWLPYSPKAWGIFTAARLEAGKLWSDMVTRHHRIRRLGWKWPEAARWFRWARGKYPNLSAQSAQQTVQDFLEAVKSASALRKKGHPEARYPWRKPKYGDVVYTNQTARIKNGFLILGHGARGKGTLAVKVPKTLTLPGRLMEVTLSYGKVFLVCKIEDAPVVGGEVTVGVDLGVNTLIAATDGTKAVLVSGREAKAVVRYRNKRLGEISSIQAGKTKGSRRHKRLQRRKYALLDKTRCRIRDLCHKATRKVADAFPRAKVIVGKAFHGAAQKLDKVRAQQVSQACTGKITQMLDYKLKGAVVVSEAYSSQTCPVCGCRQVCRRKYKCNECGFEAPRDVVGALNIRQIGMRGGLSPTPGLVAPTTTFVQPCKYPGRSQVVRAEPPQVARNQLWCREAPAARLGRFTSKKKTNMQPKTAPDQLDIKTARSVLRAKLLSAIEMQRADRKQERAHLDYAARLAHMVADDARCEDARGKANVLHNTRISRRPALRYLAVAYAFALGRPYAAQEAKAAIPIHDGGLADVLLDTQPSVNSTMKRAVREDIEAWLKGEPTAAQREALALAEVAVEAAQ